MVYYDMQQLYLFGGLLLIFAIINVQPLSNVGRLSELGALFNLLGEAATCALSLQSLQISCMQTFSGVAPHQCMGSTYDHAFLREIAAAGSLYSNHRQEKTSHVAYAASQLISPLRPQELRALVQALLFLLQCCCWLQRNNSISAGY